MSARIRSSYLEKGTGPYEGGKLLSNLLLFGRLCRRLGLDAPQGRLIEAAKALQLVDLAKRFDVYHSLRALMVTRRDDIPLFDEAFRLFWKQPSQGWTALDLRSLGEQPRQRRNRVLPAVGLEDEEEPTARPQEPNAPPATAFVPLYSQLEALRLKDFAEMSGTELESARRLIAGMRFLMPDRKTRRNRAGVRGDIDLRRLQRAALRFFGEPLFLPRRSPKIKHRPLVLICDISGSMESYTRLLLHFLHTLAGRRNLIESFLFSTRLTRVTLQMRRRSVDRALREVSSAVKDWGGGTRIGESMRGFNYQWSRRVLGWGAVVLIITDGWDRGDPELLGREASRLRRSCHRLIWLNPLLGRPGYQPLTRGAKALLPWVHDFLPVHNLASLEQLGIALARIDWRR